MHYITTEDLQEFEFLLKARTETLEDREATLHGFERAELLYWREMRNRLIMELQAIAEEGEN